MGSCNFVVFEKFAHAYKDQIPLKIMLLPKIHIVKLTEHRKYVVYSSYP